MQNAKPKSFCNEEAFYINDGCGEIKCRMKNAELKTKISLL
ncbi:MAG: hypothetical protein NT007_17835 [Candidatus Kapabacteria bacterium]|nr:hypothetical protein [Candidatus Kapabacteria bacterium]